jgi:Short C-terminal domain
MIQICAHVAPGQAWAANDKEKVMFRRRRPLLRAAAVGGGAYLAGKHVANKQADNAQMEAGQDERISQLEQQQYQLADLHQRGVLTDDEFAAAKAKVFGT